MSVGGYIKATDYQKMNALIAFVTSLSMILGIFGIIVVIVLWGGCCRSQYTHLGPEILERGREEEYKTTEVELMEVQDT